MISTQQEYNSQLVKHLTKLLDAAKAGQPSAKIKKIEKYYLGSFDQKTDSLSNQYNITKGIVETKTTLTLGAQIKPTVIPDTKSMATVDSLTSMNKIAAVIDDTLKDVLKKNSYQSFRQATIRDLVKRICVAETIWDADKQEIQIKRVPFGRFYPDPSMCSIESANYIFIEEFYSPITLKAKYPAMADKITNKSGEGSASGNKGDIQGVITGTAGDQTNQAFSYGDPASVSRSSKDIKVWKCYLKDDSTFTAEELSAKGSTDKENMQELKAKYPNGRMILFIDGLKDGVLDDKPIDYGFGFPVEVCYNIEGNTVWEGSGDVESLFEIQDRINNAYAQVKKLVGQAGSWILNDPKNGLKKSDFVNKAVLEVENMGSAGNVPQMLTSNTIDKLNMLTAYLDQLVTAAYDMARLNKQMVSGNQEEATESGEQVKALNESALEGIWALQQNYKDFLVRLTNKVILLIQQYYTTARIIRIAEGKSFIRIPTKGSMQMTPEGGQEPQNIEKYEETKDGKLELVDSIRGDLSLGRYEIDVIAGSECPRSKSENSNLYLNLQGAGLLGSGVETTALLLEQLDVPNRQLIIENIKNTPPPTIFDSPDMVKSCCELMKSLEGFTAAKREVLKKFGLPDKPDSLADAPVQEVTKESEVTDVVQLAPALISDDPQIQQLGQQLAVQKDQEAKQHEMAMADNKAQAMLAGKNAGLQQKF